MMAFRSRMRKPDEDIQVFAYNLEALLRRAMPNIEKGDRETLLKQQFVEGVSIELKRQLLQRPTLSYEETVTAGEQLDLAGQISSSQSVNEVNTSSGTNQTVEESPLVMQLMESVDILTRKVSELSQSVANVNAASVRMGHIASECRSTSGNGRRINYRQRQTENYCFVCGQMGHFEGLVGKTYMCWDQRTCMFALGCQRSPINFWSWV
jgi:NADH pyrophosphatase NudC (nudix superfamily)